MFPTHPRPSPRVARVVRATARYRSVVHVERQRVMQCRRCDRVVLWRGFKEMIARGWRYQRDAAGLAVPDRFLCSECAP